MIKAFSITAPRVLDKPCVIALRQISVTALFYLEIARESIVGEDSGGALGGGGDREWAPTLGSSYTFSSPWACSMQIGLSQECWST